MTIQDVQSDAMPVNTPVSLHAVVVTAIDTFGNRDGELWVEEATGGPFSGIAVFGAPLVQVAQLAAGDVVDITGAVKIEFRIVTDPTPRSLTELQAPAARR